MQFTIPPTGIDFLLKDERRMAALTKRKIAVLTNQNALTQNYEVSAYALKKRLGNAIKCLLTPEHGWSGFIAEGVKVGHSVDPVLNMPIYSLYGETETSIEFIRKNIDLILVDLQDVGLRCYTYGATCAKLFEKCAGSSIEIIVCDRPNPLGPKVRGPGLDPRFRSLIGYFNVPFQHGKTMGDLLSAHNKEFVEFPLTVVPCELYHKPFGYTWAPSSPNLPSWESVLLYPALVLLEGTNVSEGRGTSLPFTSFGAPGLNNKAVVDFLNQDESLGIQARPLTFTPQGGKHKGSECQGVHLLITEPSTLEAFALGIKILCFLKENYNDNLLSEKTIDCQGFPIDSLLGTDKVRKMIAAGATASQILEVFLKDA